MSVILEMVRKYLKLNPKRTGIAVGSMILCVFLLTIASNTFVWGFDYMREVEEKINGTWQARYNGITKKQAEELESQAEISKCTLIKNEDGTYQADVEFSEVKKDVFEKTQQIGGEIGMTTLEEQGEANILPNGEEAKYDIHYHMDLLDFYGITYENKTSMKQVLLGVLGIIMGISALLIYSVFSLSFLEKKKYLGLLSCVGASVWQRRMFMFGEGLLIGVVSIPAGALAGAAATIPVLTQIQKWLNGRYELYMNLSTMPDVKITLIAALLGAFTIVVAVLVPTVQAGWVNPLELVFHAGETEPEEVGGKYHASRSLEFNMALRNLRSNQKRFAKMLIFTIASICVAFNGYLAIQGMRGVYLLEDTRKQMPLDAWVQIYSDDSTVEEQITEEIRGKDWCKDAVYLSIHNIGDVVIDKKYVASDLQEFKLSWMGKENPARFDDEGESGEIIYGFPFMMVGVDDEVFEGVIKENGWENKADTGHYPVVIDDYIPVRKTSEQYEIYRNVLSIPDNEDVTIRFGTYGDYVMLYNELFRTKESKTTLHVCGSLSERMPVPVTPTGYGEVANDYTQMESYYVRCYMPYSAFERFLQDENVRKSYGKLDKEQLEHRIEPTFVNPVTNYICMNRNKGVSEEQIGRDLAKITENAGLHPFNGGIAEDVNINTTNSWKYGNIENWNRMQMMENAGEILKRIFMTGVILLVLFFTVFSLASYVATSIYMRQRELSVLKSMGMGYKNLRKMLLYENGILIGAGALFGTAMSWFIAYGQLKNIREGAATVVLHFPFGVYFLILAAMLVLTGSIVLLMVRKVRNINILDALKNENE